MIEATATPRHFLGMPPDAFLRDYWQQRPLLVRGAFTSLAADAAPPITPEDLAGLACEEGALARLVVHERATDAWSVRHGPFDEALFPTLGERDWTLLVQDVDKWDADVATLLAPFAFLPRWRIDDVMVSFAATGGSVGAHVDQYDVFLVQGEGHRRWQIDASGSAAQDFRDDVELRLLREFSPTHDWVLAPGDMLYLPPGVPHHGVAEDPCLTYSVGMRAPSTAELLGDYIDTLAADADESMRYTDPDLVPAADAAEIDAEAMRRVVEALNRLRMNDPDTLGDWFGRFITQYRSAAIAPARGPAPARIEMEWALQHGATLRRHPWARMAWRRCTRAARLFASGQSYPLPVRDARRIAGASSLVNADYAALSPRGRDCVFALLADGHYHLDQDDGDCP